MSEVGALIVRLQAETAQFREDMGKVKSDLDSLQGGADKTSASFTNIGEARGGLMLVEESIGVRLPRHLNSLIAQIPGVGAAFSAMLPIAGVVVAVEIVGKLIEHHEALAAAIRKAADENENAAIKEEDQSKALEVTNLKLDDQIAKLEHKPQHNYMKEAILETSGEIDKLAASFASDFAKMNGVLEEHLGFWHRIGRGIEDAFSGVGQGKGYGTGTEELNKLQDAMTNVEAKRRLLADAPMTKEGQTAGQQALLAALRGQISELDAAKAKFGDNKEMLLQFSTAAASTANEIKDLNLAIDAGAKKQTVAKLSQDKDNTPKKVPESDFMKQTIRDAERTDQLNAEISASLLKTWEDLNKADERLAKERADAEKTLARTTNKTVAELAMTGAQIELKATEQANKNRLALHHSSAAEILSAEITASQAQTDAEVAALQTELTDLDRFDKNYLSHVVTLEAAITKAKMKGAADRKSLTTESAQQELIAIQNSENRMKEAVASNVANSIVMNKSLAASFRQTGEQMAEQMIKNLLMMELTGDKEKLIHAKSAFHKAFDAMSGIPPAPMWGYAAGAAAFASVMSFEIGGKIPGEGAVPIVGHGGETVVTKALTDRVESSERNKGDTGGGMPSITFAPQIHAVDATGVDNMLAKHASIFQRHIASAMRRMNK